jgi:hypothetical protein
VLRRVAAAALLCALAGCGIGSADEAASSRTRDAPTRGAFHETDPYRVSNSFRGLALAAESGGWIDIDAQYCWNAARRHRIPIATHWPRIGYDEFVDPTGRVAPGSAFADLTLPEVRRLRSNDPAPYRISTMEEMVRGAARHGLEGIEWEVKGGQAFERPAIYRPVLATARQVGIRINVKTSDNLGGVQAALRRLKAAHRAGATTMLLSHRTALITKARSRYVDYVRGPWRAG